MILHTIVHRIWDGSTLTVHVSIPIIWAHGTSERAESLRGRMCNDAVIAAVAAYRASGATTYAHPADAYLAYWEK